MTRNEIILALIEKGSYVLHIDNNYQIFVEFNNDCTDGVVRILADKKVFTLGRSGSFKVLPSNLYNFLYYECSFDNAGDFIDWALKQKANAPANHYSTIGKILAIAWRTQDTRVLHQFNSTANASEMSDAEWLCEAMYRTTYIFDGDKLVDTKITDYSPNYEVYRDLLKDNHCISRYAV